MTNEEYENAIARADDFLDILKDTCHDQHDKIKELENRTNRAIEFIDKYIEEYKERSYTEKNLYLFEQCLNGIKILLTIEEILKGEQNE